MTAFLIDANLPYYIKLWHNNAFAFVRDINPAMSDLEIWDYAKKHNLIIVTKDADFTHRLAVLGAPPKVIHFRTGNMRINQFHAFINEIWREVELLIQSNNLINIYIDRIEAVK